MAASSLTVMVQLQDKVTAPARNATKAVDQFNNATKRATLGTNQYGKAVDASTRGMSRFAKSGLQQAGYQVGDFAVQVGGGTSALQAFGQQGSQLLGIFGPVGAILGAGVAIFAALGNAFVKSKEQATGLTNTTETLNNALSKTNSIGKDLADNYGVVTEEITALSKAQKVLAIQRQAQAFAAAKNALGVFAAEIDETRNRMGKFLELTPTENFRNVFIQSFADIQEQLGTKNIPGIMRLRDLLKNVATAEGMPQIIAAVTAATEQLARMGASGEKVDELIALLDTLAKSAKSVEDGFVDMNEAFMPDNFMEAMRFHEEAIGKVDKQLEETKKKAEDVSNAMAGAFGDAFKGIIMGTKSVNEAFQNMAGRIIERLFDIIIIESLVKSIAGSSTMSSISSFLSGGRATGGPVTAGKTYMVGEKGPELFTARTNGRIIPNNQMGGGINVTNNLTINSDNAAAVRSEVINMLPMIKEASKSAVLEASRRGGAFANSLGR